MPSQKSIPLRIDGMHCAACVGRVEKVLKRVPGVTGASVSFATGQATVDCGEEVAPERLVEAVEKAGYGARVPQAARLAELDAEVAAEQADRWRKAGFALAVAVPAVLRMVPGIVPHAWMIPLDRALLALAVPVLAWSGGAFFRRTARNLPQGIFDMDTLVASGTGAAWVHSALSLLVPGLLPGSGGMRGAPYLDAVPVVIGMVLLGQALEGRARRATGQALRGLLELAPAEAQRVGADGSAETVPVAALRRGDRVRVSAGARVPADGSIVAGASTLDESLLTGEPIPVARGVGERVTGGTVNGRGVLEVEVAAVGEDAALARIVALVDRAQATRPPIGALVDRIASVFVPVVLGLAVLAGVGWWLAGDAGRAVEATLATLVVACPCALGLATPVSLVLGLGNAARAGVLPRDGAALQALAEADTVVFDKTGTLTVGRPVVVGVELGTGGGPPPPVTPSPDDPSWLLRLAASADRDSNHPLANALVAAAPLDLPAASEVVVHPGLGVAARVEGHAVRVGGPRWFGNASPGGAPDANVGTPILVEVDGTYAGTIRVRDVLRPGAAEAIAGLRALGVRTVLLSGDTPAEAARVGEELGMDEVHGGVSPAGKLDLLTTLRAGGRHVAMVGDGVNDAPALAAAHVGLAMGTGTDVAMEAAGITLRRADPRAVVEALALARATLRNVKQNLALAFGYNVLMIPAAMLGVLPPALAGAAMALSSVTVVANARRLAR